MMVVTLSNIVALDEQGRKFPKTVTLIQEDDKNLIEFGLWERYYLSDLLDVIKTKRDTDRFCLDLMGRNHQGSPVYITILELKALLLASLEVMVK